jgi:hypothetical protein
MDHTDATKEPRGAARPPAPGAPRTAGALPRWESFAVEDRTRVVRAILHAARRQVESPAGGALPER